MDDKLLNGIIKEASRLLAELLEVKVVDLNKIPPSAGVYLSYNKEYQIIYVGKAVNLKRRILEDHRGGDKKMSTSTLRRSISRIYKISDGRLVRDWVRGNCSFSYISIEDHDLRDLVEVMVIAYLRKSGKNLLNFYRNKNDKKCL